MQSAAHGMLVSFTSSGFMGLPQSIGVILEM